MIRCVPAAAEPCIHTIYILVYAYRYAGMHMHIYMIPCMVHDTDTYASGWLGAVKNCRVCRCDCAAGWVRPELPAVVFSPSTPHPPITHCVDTIHVNSYADADPAPLCCAALLTHTVSCAVDHAVVNLKTPPSPKITNHPNA